MYPTDIFFNSYYLYLSTHSYDEYVIFCPSIAHIYINVYIYCKTEYITIWLVRHHMVLCTILQCITLHCIFFLKSAHIMVRSILQHAISLYYSAFYCLIKYIHNPSWYCGWLRNPNHQLKTVVNLIICRLSIILSIVQGFFQRYLTNYEILRSPNATWPGLVN